MDMRRTLLALAAALATFAFSAASILLLVLCISSSRPKCSGRIGRLVADGKSELLKQIIIEFATKMRNSGVSLNLTAGKCIDM